MKQMLLRGSVALVAAAFGTAAWAGGDGYHKDKDHGAKHTDHSAVQSDAELAADRTGPATRPATTAPAAQSSSDLNDRAIHGSANTGASVGGSTADVNDATADRSVSETPMQDRSSAAGDASSSSTPRSDTADRGDLSSPLEGTRDSNDPIADDADATVAGERTGPATRPTTRPMSNGASLNDAATDTTPAEQADDARTTPAGTTGDGGM